MARAGRKSGHLDEEVWRHNESIGIRSRLRDLRCARRHTRTCSRLDERGQVRAVDLGSLAVTILHPEVTSPDKGIYMPAMVMTFHVTNPTKLRGLKVGDQIEFQAARRQGAVMIIELRRV